MNWIQSIVQRLAGCSNTSRGADRTKIGLVLLLLFPGPGCSAPSSAGDAPVGSGWARAAIWDDGLAEVAEYDAVRPIYGVDRPYRAVLLTVKEEFDSARLVKADPPYANRELLPVIKQNAVREIPTPNYDYRIMTSTFVRRDDPSRLVKLTSTSHEWCGNTWKTVRTRKGKTNYEWSSYFDGEGDGAQDLAPNPGDLFEDQLPLALRGLAFADGLELEIRLLPSMATSHGGPVDWLDARVRVNGTEVIDVPAGSLESWRVEVTAGGRRSVYWFDRSPTHPLIRMDAGDGNRMSLTRLERRAYWKLP